jgi:proteasome assembly chaperone (PAC2) family protein
MAHMQIDRLPRLERPNIVAAFQGWNDAGQAASTAIRYLIDTWSAEPFARLDPEEFFSYSDTRPTIRIVDGERRQLSWPGNEFFWHKGMEPAPDMVMLVGTEPNLKWRTFCDEILRLAAELGAQRVVTLGALVADAVHTRPVPLTGFASDADVQPKLLARNIRRSSYEGPTGIVGVLHDACLRADLPSASIWAATPYYLGATPNPGTALGLLETLDDVLGLRLNLEEMRVVAEEFARQVTVAAADNADVQQRIESLERAFDAIGGGPPPEDLPPTGAIIADLEQFLRKQRGG